MPGEFPYNFPTIPSLSEETQLYTQRQSNASSPTEYKFTLADLTSFLQANANLVAINGDYDSDSAAATGGVAVGQVYALTAANIYGLPEGTLKKRIS